MSSEPRPPTWEQQESHDHGLCNCYQLTGSCAVQIYKAKLKAGKDNKQLRIENKDLKAVVSELEKKLQEQTASILSLSEEKDGTLMSDEQSKLILKLSDENKCLSKTVKQLQNDFQNLQTENAQLSNSCSFTSDKEFALKTSYDLKLRKRNEIVQGLRFDVTVANLRATNSENELTACKTELKSITEELKTKTDDLQCKLNGAKQQIAYKGAEIVLNKLTINNLKSQLKAGKDNQQLQIENKDLKVVMSELEKKLQEQTTSILSLTAEKACTLHDSQNLQNEFKLIQSENAKLKTTEAELMASTVQLRLENDLLESKMTDLTKKLQISEHENCTNFESYDSFVEKLVLHAQIKELEDKLSKTQSTSTTQSTHTQTDPEPEPEMSTSSENCMHNCCLKGKSTGVESVSSSKNIQSPTVINKKNHLTNYLLKQETQQRSKPKSPVSQSSSSSKPTSFVSSSKPGHPESINKFNFFSKNNSNVFPNSDDSVKPIRQIWRPKFINALKQVWRPKKVSPLIVESSTCTLKTPSQSNCVSTKHLYSLHDLLKLNMGRFSDNVWMMNECLMNDNRFVNLSDFLSKCANQSGPIQKWVPKATSSV